MISHWTSDVSILRLQQHIGVRARIDRAYEDRLAGRISDDLSQCKSREWEQELADVRRDTALHDTASHDYMVKGCQILELAQTLRRLNSLRRIRPIRRKRSRCCFRTARSIAETFCFLRLSRSTCSREGTKTGIGWVLGTISATTSSMRRGSASGLHPSERARAGASFGIATRSAEARAPWAVALGPSRRARDPTSPAAAARSRRPSASSPRAATRYPH